MRSIFMTYQKTKTTIALFLFLIGSISSMTAYATQVSARGYHLFCWFNDKSASDRTFTLNGRFLNVERGGFHITGAADYVTSSNGVGAPRLYFQYNQNERSVTPYSQIVFQTDKNASLVANTIRHNPNRPNDLSINLAFDHFDMRTKQDLGRISLNITPGQGAGSIRLFELNWNINDRMKNKVGEMKIKGNCYGDNWFDNQGWSFHDFEMN
jgi:predicted extracellular nuclease